MKDRIIASLVKPDGTLDVSKLAGKEALYEGRNGKTVERFTVSAKGEWISYIFKPLTNADTLGREAWAYDRIIPLIPIRVPMLLAHAETDDPERYWAIYEDLGRLEHRFDEDAVQRGAEAIPAWHRLPVELVPERFAGHTPPVHEALQWTADRMPMLEDVLAGLDVPSASIAKLSESMKKLNGVFPSETVVSHGDFYFKNLAVVGGETVILDWEYVHCNCVFWDLYNLLDITSPRYRKPHTNREARKKALQLYMNSRKEQGGWACSEAQFVEQYHLYASIYSAWILLLIDNDLKTGSYDPDSLKSQQNETHRVLMDGLAALY